MVDMFFYPTFRYLYSYKFKEPNLTMIIQPKIIALCIKQDRKAEFELYKLTYSYLMSICMRYSKDKDTVDPCELCKTIKADPIDIEKHGARLLTVKLKVNNVCFDKKIAIACIIYDKCHKIVAFKGFITMVCKDSECGKNECGTIERKVVFVVPDYDICNPLELDVRVIANYVYPCEPKC